MTYRQVKRWIRDNVFLPTRQKLIRSFNVRNDLIIIRIDGGIASQMLFYVLGLYYQDKGFEVKYDISLFEENGMDMDNRFVRNLVFKESFPDLKFDIATKEEVDFYKKYFSLLEQDCRNRKPPLYLGSYYYRSDLLKKYRNIFVDNFKPVLNEKNNYYLDKIKNSVACAVHVRRGDCSKDVGYGKPTSKEYFLKAINYIKDKVNDVKFFFFSDEIDWIKDNILSNVNDTNYEIVDCNSSGEGHLDLYLQSKCQHFITSVGSMAKYARYLCKNDDAISVVATTDKNDILKVLIDGKNVKYIDN